MPFLRRSYKQKPQAWGPVSQVQASIFKNAEREGIDPTSIALAMPMWGPGNQLDYGKYNLTGTNTGAVFSNNELVFDGSDYITMSGTNVLADTGKPFSTVFNLTLYNSTSPSVYPGIITARSNTSYAWQISYNTNNAGYQYIDIGSAATWSRIRSTTGPIPLNTQVQVTVTYNGLGADTISNYSIYVDGKLQTKNTASGFSNVNQATIIGATSTNRWNGAMQQALFFENFLLSASQIAYRSDNPYYLLQRVAPVCYVDMVPVTPPTVNRRRRLLIGA